jgi:hypothetical protein
MRDFISGLFHHKYSPSPMIPLRIKIKFAEIFGYESPGTYYPDTRKHYFSSRKNLILLSNTHLGTFAEYVELNCLPSQETRNETVHCKRQI